MGEIYMDGRGVVAKTDRLNDAMWTALLWAFVGLAFFVGYAVLGSSWSPASQMPWDLPLPRWRYSVDIITRAVAGVGGVAMAAPWFVAGRRISRHSKSMGRETKKHGPGWAAS